MTMPSEDRVGKALTYLAETDKELGILYAAKDAGEFLLKHTIASIGLESGEKSSAARQEVALASKGYVDAVNELRETISAYKAMEAKRKTESLIIDVWRSFNANRRQAT